MNLLCVALYKFSYGQFISLYNFMQYYWMNTSTCKLGATLQVLSPSWPWTTVTKTCSKESHSNHWSSGSHDYMQVNSVCKRITGLCLSEMWNSSSSKIWRYNYILRDAQWLAIWKAYLHAFFFYNFCLWQRIHEIA